MNKVKWVLITIPNVRGLKEFDSMPLAISFLRTGKLGGFHISVLVLLTNLHFKFGFSNIFIAVD